MMRRLIDDIYGLVGCAVMLAVLIPLTLIAWLAQLIVAPIVWIAGKLTK